MITLTDTTGKEGLHWIYLSPHLDDAALSCGGLIWEQTRAGEQASIWTICAGDAPDAQLSPFAESLHLRWQAGPQAADERRLEDLRSCERLNASCKHFSLPDCIYRRSSSSHDYFYDSEQAIFGPLHPDEAALVNQLSQEIALQLPPRCALVAPLALGGHVDHRLTRAIAGRLAQSVRHLWYYADYPYALKASDELANLRLAGWVVANHSITAAGLAAWQESVAAHRSQISTFWPDLEAMRGVIREYSQQNDGIRLWQSND